MAERATVVCALEFERRVLRGAGLGRLCALECCGPGPEAPRRWADAQRVTAPVILCGLAGALRPPFAAGQAHVPAAILTAQGRRLEPTLPGGAGGPLLVSSDSTLTTAQSKRECAQRSGADLVDRESAAFATAAAARGWTWSVVRAVSDGPDTELPPDIDEWVDALGRVRYLPLLRGLLRGAVRPGALRRLRADGVAGLRAAAALVAAMLSQREA